MSGFAPKLLDPQPKAAPSKESAEPVVAPMPAPPMDLSIPLTEARFVIIDTESTSPDPESRGPAPETDRAIEVAARIWYLNRRHRAPFVFERYVDPGCLVSPSSMSVHHITNEDIAGAAPLAKVMEEMMEMAHAAIPAAYNSEYDRKILRGTPLHNCYWLDVYRLAMKTWHIGQKNADGFPLTSFKQQELRYWLGVRKTPGEAHRAAADIHVTGLILQLAVDKFLASGMKDDLRTFLRWVEEPILHKTIPFGPCAGKTPEELEDYEIKRLFDASNRMHETLVRFNVLDMVRPEMMSRALSAKSKGKRSREKPGGPQ